MKRVILAYGVLLLAAVPLCAQNVELAGAGGLGVGTVQERDRSFATGRGASLGWLSEGIHGVKFDYLFVNIRRDRYYRHLLTGSYVVQRRSGQSRPFVEIGAGLMYIKWKDVLNPAGAGDAHDFVGSLGGGVTMDLGRSLFLRPQVRTYWYAGPTFVVLPMISVGLRF